MKGALVALLVILAGCSGPADPAPSTSSTPTVHRTAEQEPWTALPCDRGRVQSIAHSAEPVAGLQGSADAIARRIAQALGDPVTGPAAPYDDSPYDAWPTAKGSLIVQMEGNMGLSATEGDFVGATYLRNGGSLTGAQVVAMATSLGAEAGTLRTGADRETGSLWQEWDGGKLGLQPYGQAGATWQPQRDQWRLDIGPFFTFLASDAQVSQDDAVSAGRAYVRCVLDREGKTEAKGYMLEKASILGVAVHNRTITHLVNVHHATKTYSPCGDWDARWVFVDAVTGAVKESKLGPCL